LRDRADAKQIELDQVGASEPHNGSRRVVVAADLQQFAEIYGHIIEQWLTDRHRPLTRARAAARRARAGTAIVAGDEDLGPIYLCLTAAPPTNLMKSRRFSSMSCVYRKP
jgi:hypothetical protein